MIHSCQKKRFFPGRNDLTKMNKPNPWERTRIVGYERQNLNPRDQVPAGLTMKRDERR